MTSVHAPEPTAAAPRPTLGKTEAAETPTALIKCGSHRARGKMLALVGRDNAQALFSLERETGKGVYRIPADLATQAKAITGVTGFRDGDDLMDCWPVGVTSGGRGREVTR